MHSVYFGLGLLQRSYFSGRIRALNLKLGFLPWLGWLAVMLLPSTATAASSDTVPTRIGVFMVKMNMNAQGTYAGSISTPTGSASWSEDYNWTLQSETRMEVVQSGSDRYHDGETLQSHSSQAVGGGGSATSPGGTKHWTYEADPINATNSYVAASVYLSLKTNTVSSAWASLVDIGPPGRYKIEPVDETPENGAWQAVAEAVNGLSGANFEVPSDLKASWTYTKSVSTNVSWQGLFDSAEASATCVYTVEYLPEGLPQWEAIMEPNPYPPMLAFDKWLPTGGESEDKAGGGCTVLVTLRNRENPDTKPPTATFTIQLSDVSREPGVCMNFPYRSAPPGDGDPEAPFDLRIAPGPDMTVADDGQLAEVTNSIVELRLGIQTFDYGAFGKLKITAHTTDGQTIVAHVIGHQDQFFLNIPLDDNQNYVADSWERDKGVFDRNLDAKWEGTLDPKYDGQALEGDGISLYEKYRGFLVLTSAPEPEHERLDPKLKYLFVRNPDRLAREVFRSEDGVQESYPAASKCEVRYISSTGWTGPGAFKDKKRIVNFNRTQDKHAVDQHALFVTVNPSKNPFEPGEWVKIRNTVDKPAPAAGIDHLTEGCMYPDYTAPSAFIPHWRPASAYQVEIYAANVTGYVHRCVRYHTQADCPVPCDNAKLDALTGAYVGAYRFSFQTKYTIELSATMAHEMGHGTGVNHHTPEESDYKDPDLAQCTMRYYDPSEYPRNVGDRFELFTRGHNPSSFCRKTFDCWGQLQITDNPAASKGAAKSNGLHYRPSEIARAGLLPPLFPVETPLEISADLEWQDVIAGDPLRLWVRLHGTTSAVGANWTEGLVLTLWRHSEGKPPEVVLESDRWPAFLQPVTFDTRLLAITNVTAIREFLVPPDAADLEAGRYSLDITWKGTAFAPAMLLPTNGVITVPPIEFEVQAPTNDLLQALGHRHLAWYHYLAENPQGVLTHTREASRLDPDASDPLAIQTQLMRATAAANSGAFLEGAQVLDGLRRRLPSEGSHVTETVTDRFSVLTPKVRVVGAPTAGQGPALEVTGLPGQTYVLQASGDLRTWTSISTNTPGTGTFEWSQGPASGGAFQFFRILWGP